METTTVESKFETAYSEFKKYGKFYFDFLKDFKEKRKEQDKYIFDNIDDESKIQNYILEYNSLPNYYASDLDKLKERLITIYEVAEDLIEISDNIKSEMQEIINKKNPILFKIVEGKAEAIDSTLIDQLKENAKKSYEELLKNIKKVNE